MLSEKELKYLFQAIRQGEEQAAADLMKRANTEVKNEYGWTPLMMASFWGQLNLVKHLCQIGADLSQKSKLGMTAIMLAAIKKNSNIVRYLYHQSRKN